MNWITLQEHTHQRTTGAYAAMPGVIYRRLIVTNPTEHEKTKRERDGKGLLRVVSSSPS